jgi:hypothetical protein
MLHVANTGRQFVVYDYSDIGLFVNLAQNTAAMKIIVCGLPNTLNCISLAVCPKNKQNTANPTWK